MIDHQYCLLIADDEVRMTKALADFFRAKGFAVLLAQDGAQALDVYYNHNQEVDVILLDVMMPKLDGLQVLRQLREQQQTVPVILLTAKSQEEDQLEGLGGGADDYVTKPFSPLVLHARVQALLKRMGKTDSYTLHSLGLCMDFAQYTVTIDGKPIELTRREFDLLHYLVLNKNIALSRERLLSQVWGYEFDGDIRTVDTHIKQLRVKLQDRAAAIKTLHRIGYLFEVNP